MVMTMTGQQHLEEAAQTVEPVGFTISVVWDGKRAIGTHQVWWVRENYRGESGRFLSAREAAEEHVAFLLVRHPDWQAELISLVAA